MTKRERLYHSLVKSGKLPEYKLATKKLRVWKRRKRPAGIYIDMAYLRSCTEESGMTVAHLIDLAITQNIIFGKTDINNGKTNSIISLSA